MPKRDKPQPKPNPADLRGWGAKLLEDVELALRNTSSATGWPSPTLSPDNQPQRRLDVD